MARSKNPRLLGLLLGSPFAFLGLVFLLGGKVGVGLPFLLLGLAPALAGAAAGRKAAPPADDPPGRPTADGEPAEPGVAADGGGR